MSSDVLVLLLFRGNLVESAASSGPAVVLAARPTAAVRPRQGNWYRRRRSLGFVGSRTQPDCPRNFEQEGDLSLDAARSNLLSDVCCSPMG